MKGKRILETPAAFLSNDVRHPSDGRRPRDGPW